MKLRWILAGLLLASSLYAQITTTHGKLKLVHAKATQTPQKVKLILLEPAQDQVVPGPDVTVKFSVTNWLPQKNGKHLHFILDNEPIQEHFSGEAFVFRNIAPGAHVIRVFPVYGWHESVKQQDAMAISRFYVKEKTGSVSLDTSKPMMVYSTPVGEHDSAEKLTGQPHPGILVDWFLKNISIGSKAGYFVSITVDGQQLMSMKEWRPHYIQGLPPGNHSIKLELLHNGVPVKENWNTTDRTITVR